MTAPSFSPSTQRSPSAQFSRSALTRRIGRGVGLVVLVLAAMVAFGPLLWTLTTSLREPAESFTNPPVWLPLDPDFSNYAKVFSEVSLGRFFLNSVIVTGLIVGAQIITCTLSGYAFAMVRFPGRGAIFALFLATMMVPVQTTIIPVFVLISRMGLSDSLASLILPAIGSAFGTFLMRQYFLQMPVELGEAARVDGASRFQVFRLIYAPMATPAMATLAILAFTGFWAEFYRPLIFLQSQENFTLPLGLVTLQGTFGTGSISVVLAGVILSMIPSVILFVIAQRRFVEGITAGSFR
ncbi:carbohydrate ABC transporter permease [Promicromonospora sukumoe]|uniref:carbohydrate ABC transporter permease n=1 Tax=Promicromonospora sukumoe TaxID=88382 RepID=UPI0037C7C1B2